MPRPSNQQAHHPQKNTGTRPPQQRTGRQAVQLCGAVAHLRPELAFLSELTRARRTAQLVGWESARVVHYNWVPLGSAQSVVRCGEPSVGRN